MDSTNDWGMISNNIGHSSSPPRTVLSASPLITETGSPLSASPNNLKNVPFLLDPLNFTQWMINHGLMSPHNAPFFIDERTDDNFSTHSIFGTFHKTIEFFVRKKERERERVSERKKGKRKREREREREKEREREREKERERE
jgi:hypothetical protein